MSSSCPMRPLRCTHPLCTVDGIPGTDALTAHLRECHPETLSQPNITPATSPVRTLRGRPRTRTHTSVDPAETNRSPTLPNPRTSACVDNTHLYPFFASLRLHAELCRNLASDPPNASNHPFKCMYSGCSDGNPSFRSQDELGSHQALCLLRISTTTHFHRGSHPPSILPSTTDTLNAPPTRPTPAPDAPRTTPHTLVCRNPSCPTKTRVFRGGAGLASHESSCLRRNPPPVTPSPSVTTSVPPSG